MTGIDLIAAERKRQIEECGHVAERDDGYPPGELILAALGYGIMYVVANAPLPTWIRDRLRNDTFTIVWPWRRDTFHSDGALRDLAKLGALAAAEADRRLRLEAKKQEPPPT